ncbi:uncharacterized protein TEOVI_000433600 [Trypanosoma equiperdum]|uniref:Transmembrane protein n=4 Tax=Trypanozoon TaxID=39700 RepID=Q383R9_TRYB2|nr:hypothetical protein, conserved [Trypanosoma brucei gambiense DAL972]XP_829074.1 hypothetical protein, conserved [Trypanosoma brucei brucei TREU927]RHW68082.1 hypothetical protein DPX39_110072600 [Trypanosoma brucei equiperdum]SCU72758.1 hypothetical protein, conserved [Trypanosoma equiperdum]EAN79962.1 hypothetical protein, conserved [Trypanosoma brucei brucei TREU927]CBH18016.1 hypothetical protein, conserved [Trypanosoma brucei gambiense DAL972]|eukprot:XP_011780280.1 hypothetical protein, conserved [Trypanosoma brucei gambiense DAL972]
MLRRTSLRAIKPYLHAFSPGARASEKGMLYRNSNMNAHARVASIQQAQRTHREGKIFLMLLVPDQVFLSVVLVGVSLVAVLLYFRQQPFSFNTHKQRWILGAINEHEFYQRNREMSNVLAAHREAIEGTRDVIGDCPKVFEPPVGSHYISRSGDFAPRSD